MKFRRIELGIKIGSLGDESRRIKSKEQTLLLKGGRYRAIALAKHKGLDKDEFPEKLKDELQRRLTPQVERAIKSSLSDDEPSRPMRVMDKGARKVIRKFLREGLTKEEILAIPAIQKSYKYIPIYNSLRWHRKGVIRHESRHAQAALSFLRGRPFSNTEDKPQSYPNWDKVIEIANRFSNEDKRILNQRFEQWSQEAQSFIRGRQLMDKGKRHFRQEPLRMLA